MKTIMNILRKTTIENLGDGVWFVTTTNYCSLTMDKKLAHQIATCLYLADEITENEFKALQTL